MICPHCNIGVHPSPNTVKISRFTRKDGTRYEWQMQYQQCPECGEVFIYLDGCSVTPGPTGVNENPFLGPVGTPYTTPEVVQPAEKHLMIWPQDGSRICPAEVPDPLRKDFHEAAAVLPRSAQASAALTRRCLQYLLKEYAKTKAKDLAAQIDEVISSNTLSSTLSEQLDAVRNIGNFAAHPQKSTNTGEIIEVEPQEAEWNLDVLDELFVHYFVKPAQLQKRRSDLNKKLADAGKPPLS